MKKKREETRKKGVATEGSPEQRGEKRPLREESSGSTKADDFRVKIVDKKIAVCQKQLDGVSKRIEKDGESDELAAKRLKIEKQIAELELKKKELLSGALIQKINPIQSLPKE